MATVHKSVCKGLNRDEDNWMHLAAQRTANAGAEWTRQRKEALRAYRSVCGELSDEEVHSPKRAPDEIEPILSLSRPAGKQWKMAKDMFWVDRKSAAGLGASLESILCWSCPILKRKHRSCSRRIEAELVVT
ncbi:hypothetical protein PHLGIDRAFT_131019 [Phlebiopsis gigantea 11061_1 CR5-6]|uniref:Uncharacterized protein n=1 Tax=Phlebiopsis gigantea (strain 11061_1 CR5-6) TaxID=745531 RepID=A0A0C3S2N6_PHLG1|nr:hypothetical protein PHLGIDRAFT_131019 [Phlebiopsis gigantea 11061_1 CR5-6]